MKRNEFLRLIGGNATESDYRPVACLLRNGYGCAGYYIAALNEEFTDTCVLVNARLMDLRGPGSSTGLRRTIEDFNEFLEEIVRKIYAHEDGFTETFFEEGDRFGRNIPLMAVHLDEITLLYPVAYIGTLMQRAIEAEPDQTSELPSFLDFDRRSIVLKLLRTKLW